MSTLKEKSSLDITATFSLNPVCTESHNLVSVKEPTSEQQDSVQQVYVSHTTLMQKL